jgi:hypothetical protein
MKICVTAVAPSLDAQIDPRFGRCAYFIIIDPDTMSFKAIARDGMRRYLGLWRSSHSVSAVSWSGLYRPRVSAVPWLDVSAIGGAWWRSHIVALSVYRRMPFL